MGPQSRVPQTALKVAVAQPKSGQPMIALGPGRMWLERGHQTGGCRLRVRGMPQRIG